MTKIMLYLVDIDRLVGSALDEETVRTIAPLGLKEYIYFFIEES